jgi:hypothetical protein
LRAIFRPAALVALGCFFFEVVVLAASLETWGEPLPLSFDFDELFDAAGDFGFI